MSQVFAFQSRQVRTITENNQPWFVAKDVCAALGLGWSGTSLNGIPDAWQGMWRDHTPRAQKMKIISEPAVYKLAFRSNKPEADAFTNWVASEVLPAIRKTGKYEPAPRQLPLPPANPSPDERQAELSSLRNDFAMFSYETIKQAESFRVRLHGITAPLYKEVFHRLTPRSNFNSDPMFEGWHHPSYAFRQELADTMELFFTAIRQARSFTEALRR